MESKKTKKEAMLPVVTETLPQPSPGQLTKEKVPYSTKF